MMRLNLNKIFKLKLFDQEKISFECILRIDTINELEYYKADGILNFVLKNILNYLYINY